MKKIKYLSIGIILICFISAIIPSVTGCNNTPFESNRWTDLLGVIPANENTLQAVYLRDDLLKAELEAQYRPSETIINSFDYYFFPASGGNINTRDYNDTDWLRDLGFTKENISRVIIAGELAPPFTYYQAAQGQFDEQVIYSAVKTGSLHERLEVINYNGQDYYSTGADNQIDLTVQSGAHPLGMAYRMAILDDTILFCNTTSQMEEMIDSCENKTDPLKDAKYYPVISKTLDDFNVFYAFISSASYSLSHIKEVYEIYKNEKDFNDTTLETSGKRLTELEKAVLLKPIETLASGIGLDENGYYLIVILANADEATAKENAALLEKRLNQANDTQFSALWTTFMDGKREISYRSNFTMAKIYGQAYKLWSFSSAFQTPMWGFVTDAFLVTK